MAKIVSTLNLRNRFEILKVEMQSPDFLNDEDFNMMERYVASNPLFTHFRYLTGMRRYSDGHYFTYYLCSKSPLYSFSYTSLHSCLVVVLLSKPTECTDHGRSARI